MQCHNYLLPLKKAHFNVRAVICLGRLQTDAISGSVSADPQTEVTSWCLQPLLAYEMQIYASNTPVGKFADFL
jgi:hypothetical protein